MAFVHEEISRHDKDSVDFIEVDSRFRNVFAAPSDWVVNRDRNAFLVWLYPEREPPYAKHYALVVAGRAFEVAVVDSEVQRSDGSLILVKKIVALTTTNRNIGGEQSAEIRTLAQEATLAWEQWMKSRHPKRLADIVVEMGI